MSTIRNGEGDLLDRFAYPNKFWNVCFICHYHHHHRLPTDPRQTNDTNCTLVQLATQYVNQLVGRETPPKYGWHFKGNGEIGFGMSMATSVPNFRVPSVLFPEISRPIKHLQWPVKRNLFFGFNTWSVTENLFPILRSVWASETKLMYIAHRNNFVAAFGPLHTSNKHVFNLLLCTG